jgi:hypothetical protein
MMLCGSGFYIAWYISLQSVRNSQRAIISNSTFHNDRVMKFVFSKADVKNNPDLVFDDDGENEFEYKHQMYDVINKSTIGGTIYFTCISDKDEDQLNDIFISRILETGNTNGKQLPILKFRIDHYTNDIKNKNVFLSMGNRLNHFYVTYDAGKLLTPYLNTSSPPPWNFA